MADNSSSNRVRLTIPEGFGLPRITRQVVGHSQTGRKIYRNEDGSQSSERTITISHPDLNGGAPTNIPTVFDGQQLTREDATRRILEAQRAANRLRTSEPRMQAGPVDPETSRPLPGYGDYRQAASAAQLQSRLLRNQEVAEFPGAEPAALTERAARMNQSRVPLAIPEGFGVPETTHLGGTAEFFKGVPRGAVGLLGQAITGVGANSYERLAHELQVFRDIGNRSFEEMSEEERIALGNLSGAGYQIIPYMSAGPEDRARMIQALEEQTVNGIAENPTVRLGQDVSDIGQETFAPKPGYETSTGRALGEGAGSLGAGVLLSAIPGAGPWIAAGVFSAAGSGEAVDRAIRAGATEDEIIQAAKLGVLPGLTDSVPIETLMGRLPIPGGKYIQVPANLLGAALKRIGRIGWQAFIEGAQEGGQQFVQNLIAQQVYAPGQDLGEGVIANAKIGGILGGMAEGGRQVLVGRRRGPASSADQTTEQGQALSPQAPAPASSPLEDVTDQERVPFTAPSYFTNPQQMPSLFGAPVAQPTVEATPEQRAVDLAARLRERGGEQAVRLASQLERRVAMSRNTTQQITPEQIARAETQAKPLLVPPVSDSSLGDVIPDDGEQISIEGEFDPSIYEEDPVESLRRVIGDGSIESGAIDVPKGDEEIVTELIDVENEVGIRISKQDMQDIIQDVRNGMSVRDAYLDRAADLAVYQEGDEEIDSILTAEGFDIEESVDAQETGPRQAGESDLAVAEAQPRAEEAGAGTGTVVAQDQSGPRRTLTVSDGQINRLRRGGSPRESLRQFPMIASIIERGGIDPVSPLASEIRARDLHKRFVGILRKGGQKSLDDFWLDNDAFYANASFDRTLAEDQESGNGRLTENQVLELVDRELSGNPTRGDNDVAFLDTPEAMLAELQDQIGRTGADLNLLSNAEIERFLAETDETPDGSRAALRNIIGDREGDDVIDQLRAIEGVYTAQPPERLATAEDARKRVRAYRANIMKRKVTFQNKVEAALFMIDNGRGSGGEQTKLARQYLRDRGFHDRDIDRLADGAAKDVRDHIRGKKKNGGTIKIPAGTILHDEFEADVNRRRSETMKSLKSDPIKKTEPHPMAPVTDQERAALEVSEDGYQSTGPAENWEAEYEFQRRFMNVLDEGKDLDPAQVMAQRGNDVRGQRPADQPPAQQVERIADEVNAEAERLGLRRFVNAVNMHTYLRIGDVAIEGAYDRGENMVYVAMTGDDAVRTLRHETIHAMRHMGLFDDKEWALLERHAQKNWLKKHDIVNRWEPMLKNYDADMANTLAMEEAIAEEFSYWRDGGNTPGPVRKVFERMQRFLEALGNALRGMGFTTYQDLFDSIESGRRAERETNQRPMPPRPQNEIDFDKTKEDLMFAISLVWEASREGSKTDTVLSEGRRFLRAMNTIEDVRKSKPIAAAIDHIWEMAEMAEPGDRGKDERADEWASRIQDAVQILKSVKMRKGQRGRQLQESLGGLSHQIMQHPAYHGSPHKFHSFDISKIGSGEGAQVYGWGLYFADREGVARHYRDGLSRRQHGRTKIKSVSYKGRDLPNKYPLSSEIIDLKDQVIAKIGWLVHSGVSLDKSISRALEDFNTFYIQQAEKDLRRAQEVLRQSLLSERGRNGAIEGDKTRVTQMQNRLKRYKDIAQSIERLDRSDWKIVDDKPGSLMKVELAPEQDEYLLWDEPISAQSDKVKAGLESLGITGRSNLSELETQLEDGIEFMGDKISEYVDKGGDPSLATIAGEVLSSMKQIVSGLDVDSARELNRLYERLEDEVSSPRPTSKTEDRDAYRAVRMSMLRIGRSIGTALSETNRKGGGRDTGQRVYSRLKDIYGNPKAASEALKSVGIRGNKYLDGASRKKGEGSYNYVIFDDADIKIEEILASMPAQQAIETPQFKAWFRDSKVVDEQGQPLVVYHGTDEVFSGFMPGSYFTAHPAEASAYSGARNTRMREGARQKYQLEDGSQFIGQRLPYSGILSDALDYYGRETGKVYATDQAIARYLGDGRWSLLTGVEIDYSASSGDADSVIIKAAPDSTRSRDLARQHVEYADSTYPGKDTGNVLPVYLSIQNPLRMSPLDANKYGIRLGATREENAKAFEALKAQGYDGIITVSDEATVTPEMQADLGGIPEQYIIFEPSQAKSIHNRGTFDPANPDILASVSPPMDERIRAYHGSPHDFDRFDMDKMGTGEGGQLVRGVHFYNELPSAMLYRNPAARWGDIQGMKRYDQMSGDGGHYYEVLIDARPEQILDVDMLASELPSGSRLAGIRDAKVASESDPVMRQTLAEHMKVRNIIAGSESEILEDGFIGVKRTRPGGETEYSILDTDRIEIVAKDGRRTVKFDNRGTFDPANPDILAQMPTPPVPRSQVAPGPHGPNFHTDHATVSRILMDENRGYLVSRASDALKFALQAANDPSIPKRERAKRLASLVAAPLRLRLQEPLLDLKETQRAIVDHRGVLIGNQDVYRKAELMYGAAGQARFDYREAYREKLVEEMRERDVKVEELDEFLHMKHAEERNIQIAKINPEFPDGGSGMTTDHANNGNPNARTEAGRLGLNNIPADRRAALEAVAQHVYAALKKSRQDMVRFGLESQQTIDQWEAMYPNYVPLRGIEFDANRMDPHPAEGSHGPSSGSGPGFSVGGAESMRAKGRASRAADIAATALTMGENTIVRGEKNQVGQRLMALVLANPDKDFWRVRSMTSEPRKLKVGGKTITVPGVPTTRTRVQTKAGEQIINVPNMQWGRGKDDQVIFFKLNGVEYGVEIRHQGLFNAMKGHGSDAISSVLTLPRMWNQLQSAVNTSLSPIFMFVNAIRDFETAIFTLSEGDLIEVRNQVLTDVMKFRPIRGMMDAKKGVSSDWAQFAEDFRHDGGQVTFIDAHRVQKEYAVLRDAAKALNQSKAVSMPKKAIKATLDMVETWNTRIENMLRLALYRRLRERMEAEGTPTAEAREKAAHEALNLTVNFHRKGTWARNLNALYLFFNASVQGTFRLVKALKSPKVRRMAYATIAAGAIVDQMNALMAPDDDDGENSWDKVQDWEKETNMVFMVPSFIQEELGLEPGAKVKIPLAYGINAFWNMGRLASAAARRQVTNSGLANMGTGEKPLKAVGDAMAVTLDNFNFMGGSSSLTTFLMPTIADPIYEWATNRDAFDRPIKPEQNPFGTPVPSSQMAWKSTPEAYKIVADQLNELTGGNPGRGGAGAIDMSPEFLDYFVGLVTGSAGRFVSDMIQTPANLAMGEIPDVNRVPVFNRFYTTKSQWAERGLFYDRMNAIQAIRDNIKDLREFGRAHDAEDVLKDHERMVRLYPIFSAARKQLQAITRRKNVLEETNPPNKEEMMERLDEREARVLARANGAYHKARADMEGPD